MTRLLVVGYGNELRGDDGIGPRVAREVACWGREGVEALEAAQLVPEMAERLSRCDQVVFVDARVTAGAVEVAELRGRESARLGHTSDPRELLALTGLIYGRVPRAWLVTVPGLEFGVGEGLSGVAEEGLREALGEIHRLADRA